MSSDTLESYYDAPSLYKNENDARTDHFAPISFAHWLHDGWGRRHGLVLWTAGCADNRGSTASDMNQDRKPSPKELAPRRRREGLTRVLNHREQE
jgi:hypothetical protein